MKTETLNTTTFETTLAGTDKPVLVDFYAEWCGPCKMLGPVIDEIADERGGEAVVAKVDIEQSPDLASRYGVTSIPALIVFKDGQPVETAVGVRSKDAINSLIDNAA